MKKSDFTTVNTPFGGGNLLNPATWVSMILSVGAMLIALAVGQSLARRVESASGGRIDGSPDSFVSRPATVARQREVL